VVFAAEGDGLLRPVKEGRRCLLGGENFMLLVLALAGGHVHRRSPKDYENVLHSGETVGAPVSPILLGLILLRGDATVVFLKHVALLEGVIDRGLLL
jgi:hypothetical protein